MPSTSGIEFVRLTAVPLSAVMALLNEPRSARHMPLAKQFSEVEAAGWVRGKDAQWGEHGYGSWAVLLDGAFAGWGGFQREDDGPDFTLVLRPEQGGRGAGIAWAALAMGFDEFGFEAVLIALPLTRRPTGAVARLGFVADGEIVYMTCRSRGIGSLGRRGSRVEGSAGVADPLRSFPGDRTPVSGDLTFDVRCLASAHIKRYDFDMVNAIRALREAAGLSQSELALRSGVAQPNIAAYESGKRSASSAMAQRLRDAARPLPHEALAANRAALEQLAAQYGLSNVRVFGSAARGTDAPGSDLDLLVTRSSGVGLLGIAAFSEAASELLGVEVDVVTEGGLSANHEIMATAVAV